MPGVWLLSCLCYYDFKCAVKAGGLQASANLTKFCSWKEFPIYDAAPRQHRTGAVGPVFSGLCSFFIAGPRMRTQRGPGTPGAPHRRILWSARSRIPSRAASPSTTPRVSPRWSRSASPAPSFRPSCSQFLHGPVSGRTHFTLVCESLLRY